MDVFKYGLPILYFSALLIPIAFTLIRTYGLRKSSELNEEIIKDIRSRVARIDVNRDINIDVKIGELKDQDRLIRKQVAKLRKSVLLLEKTGKLFDEEIYTDVKKSVELDREE